jgi:hypothetical protein
MAYAGSRAFLLAALLSMAPAAWAQEVAFLSPSHGETVRGVVYLRATKPAPEDGWISYKIAPAGQEGQYVAAVIKPFEYAWDTRARGKDGKPLFADGEYVLTATAFDPSANTVGESRVVVRVANEIPASVVGEPVRLRCSYQRGQQLRFSAEAQLTLTLPEEEKKRTLIPLHLDLLVVADWTETVLTPTGADSPAVIDKVLERGYLQVVGGEGTQLPGAGQRFRLCVYPNAAIELLNDKDKHFPLGEYFVRLPERMLYRGDSWEDELAVLPLPNAIARHVLRAQHRLDGYEYAAGQRCARLVSTFSETDKPVLVKVGQAIFPLKTSYQATRHSYFGLDSAHFVAFEEITKHTIELPYQVVQVLYQLQLGQPWQTAAGGGAAAGALPGAGLGPMGEMPGSMGPEGAMMGPMGPMPGGMMGMPGAPGGVAPYGMPGAGLAGMGGAMGAQQMPPVKVNIESHLKITEKAPAPK